MEGRDLCNKFVISNTSELYANNCFGEMYLVTSSAIGDWIFNVGRWERYCGDERNIWSEKHKTKDYKSAFENNNNQTIITISKVITISLNNTIKETNITLKSY